MTLDEAIEHAREIAKRGGECAKDHEQLAGWLEELRKLKTITATLGRGTCKIKQHRCTACDHEINEKAYFVRVDLENGCWTANSRTANYCPNCGCKVVKQ